MKKARPNTRPRHKPRYEGEVINNLYCPCGWCKERHARAVAEYLNFDGVKCLCWVIKAPCINKVERMAMKLTKKVKL